MAMRDYRPNKGREVDGRHATDKYTRLDAALRRRELAGKGLCINGGHHGEATDGVRCWRCWLVYKHGVVVARTLPHWPPDGTFTRPEVEPIPCTPAGDCRTSQPRGKRGRWYLEKRGSGACSGSSASVASTS
jgi:hypothetical protein